MNSVLGQKTIDALGFQDSALFYRVGGGFTEIYAPDGSTVLYNKLKEDEEGLVIADLNMGEITRAKHWCDTLGHYSRPDLLWLGVDYREKTRVRSE